MKLDLVQVRFEFGVWFRRGKVEGLGGVRLTNQCEHVHQQEVDQESVSRPLVRQKKLRHVR